MEHLHISLSAHFPVLSKSILISLRARYYHYVSYKIEDTEISCKNVAYTDHTSICTKECFLFETSFGNRKVKLCCVCVVIITNITVSFSSNILFFYSLWHAYYILRTVLDSFNI